MGSNLIPKEPTQQSIFLSKYPKCDGRGIKIAIIDSGIDVSLDGLKRTSEGLPKIIDCFDFTGAGNVDTTAVREMNSKNELIGLSGRKLKIPKKWINPSGKWHLGIKSLYKPKITSISQEDVETYEDEESTIKMLPEIDCIVWFNGQKWLACIETLESLEYAKVLTNFRNHHEYGSLLFDEIKLPYCITVHDEGNLLEIFAPAHDHGSVVAQVVAAYFSKDSEMNGLAPGAQIVAMCVVDSGTKHLLNVQALKKALLKCMEMEVDIINYSLNNFAGDEEIEKLIIEMVNKHNIIFFKGAGNYGPFYCSTNRYYYYNIENEIFTIGALLTPHMKKLIYGTPPDGEDSPPVVFDFSSRGPGEGGSRGIDFVAPGAVLAHIPQFTTLLNNFFHGTSFASPNAAGSAACLLTALKENSIQYSPSLIKFALFKTAYLPENANKLFFGNGIFQIDAAFDYCKNEMDFKIPKYLKGVTKGIIYILEDVDETQYEFDMDLSTFINVAAVEEVETAAAKWTLELSPKAEKFIEISEVNPNHLFSVKLDITKLEPGNLNYAEIYVLHPLKPTMGSILNIPVTVVVLLNVTDTCNHYIQKEISLNYENSYHIFFNTMFESCKRCRVIFTALENYETKLNIWHCDGDKVHTARKTNKVLEFDQINQIQTYYTLIERKAVHELIFNQTIGSPSNVTFKVEFYFEKNE